jgi:hypothetical protein
MLVSESTVRSMAVSAEYVETPSFKPLPHAVVLDSIEAALNTAGLQIARRESGEAERYFTVVDGGAKMYATLPLTSRIDEESQLMIGIVNSWNKTLSLRVGFGSRVFVCTNGSFFAEKVIGRKHTPNILTDLPILMAKALEQTKTYVEQQHNFFKRLRDVNLTPVDVNDFVVRAALDHDVITVGEIGDVVNEFRKPRFEEFAPRTAWSLHNAFTEVGKRIQQKNGVLHASRMVRLSGLFADSFASDLKLIASEATAEVAATGNASAD